MSIVLTYLNVRATSKYSSLNLSDVQYWPNKVAKHMAKAMVLDRKKINNQQSGKITRTNVPQNTNVAPQYSYNFGSKF